MLVNAGVGEGWLGDLGSVFDPSFGGVPASLKQPRLPLHLHQLPYTALCAETDLRGVHLQLLVFRLMGIGPHRLGPVAEILGLVYTERSGDGSTRRVIAQESRGLCGSDGRAHDVMHRQSVLGQQDRRQHRVRATIAGVLLLRVPHLATRHLAPWSRPQGRSSGLGIIGEGSGSGGGWPNLS